MQIVSNSSKSDATTNAQRRESVKNRKSRVLLATCPSIVVDAASNSVGAWRQFNGPFGSVFFRETEASA